MRTRRTWWGAAVVGAALAAGWSLGLAGGPRAEAGPGLSALCERTAMSVVPTSLVFTGDAVTGERHQLALPASAVATTPDADGSPSITAANLQPLHLDNDGRVDLEVALGIRSSTAPEAVDPTGATPLDGLLTENFGFTPDSAASGVGVGVTGVDLVLRLPADPSTSWIRRVPQDKYAATVGFRLERVLVDQSGRPVTDAKGRPVVADHLEVEMRVDALQVAARAADRSGRFPDEARLSFVLKGPGDVGPSQDDAIWGVGQEVVLDGAAGPVPLDTGVAVARVATGQESGEPLLDLDLAWDQVPEDFALSVGQTCPSPTGGSAPAVHLAGNLPRTADSGHDVEVALRSGIGAGLGGGDELRFEGRIEGVSRHLGLASGAGKVGDEDRDRSLHLVGCGACEVPDDPPGSHPTLVVDRLDVATDDPGTTADEPIHVHGRLDGVSSHVQVVTHRDPTSGEVDEVQITSCPGLVTESARDELSELVPVTAASLAQTERAAGCVDPTLGEPGEPVAVDVTDDAHLVVQNFLPDGPYGEQSGQSSDLLDPPAAHREARTDCRYRQRGPDQPWDLVCEELPEVERTGFILAATLHPQGPPVDTDVLLVRAGVGLRQLDHARIRIEAGSRRPPAMPAAPDDRATHGARDTASIDWSAGLDTLDPQVLIQLDRSTHRTDADLNRGLKLVAIGEIDTLRGGESTLTFEILGSGTVENRRDAVPFRMEVDGFDDVDITLDQIETQLPGRAGAGDELPAAIFAGQAQIELPENDSGVEITESFDDGRRSTVRWMPGQTPRAAEIRLAGELHTANRPEDHNLRLYADLDDVKFPASVVVDRGPDGRLLDLTADACPVVQCSNSVELDASMSRSHSPASTGFTLVEGRRLDDEITLDTGAPRPWVAPRAAERRNDLTVIIAEPADPDLVWEASLDLLDLVRLSYRAVPNGVGAGPGTGADVCLEGEAIVGRGMTTLLKTPELWFNGHLTIRRPRMRLQAVPVGENDPDRPSIWVDTTSCSATEPPVDATAFDVEPDTPEDAGFVDAVAIFAPDTAPGTGGAALAELPAPVRPDSDDVTYHMSMHTERAADGSTAAAARLSLPVSEQLLVWQPKTACESWASCHSPTWQRADRTRLGVQVQSTAAPPRALLVTANIADPTVTGTGTGTGTSGATGWRFSGEVPQLPASLHADAAMDELAGPGWTDVRLDAVASEPLGRVQIEATDRSPDRVGFTGPALGPDRLPIPEHALDLRNAGDELHITARRRDGEDVNRGAAPSSLPGGPLCPGHTATRRGPPGIAYVHTEIDLAGGPSGSSAPARDLTVDVVNGKEGPRDVDQMGHLVTVSSDEPVDGTVRTRLTNIVVDQSAIGPEPIKWLHDLLQVPALADLLAGGDIDLDGCVDLDLPLELALTNASVARLAGEGSVFALDADQGPGAETELRVGEFVGPELTHHEGIPNAYREVDYDVGPLYAYHEPNGSGTAAVNDWKDTAAVPVQPGSTDIGDCDALHAAISLPGTGAMSTGAGTLPTGVVSGSVTDRDGTVTDVSLTRATFVLDLLWSAPQRNAMALDDLFGFTGCAGSDLFRALARSGTPPVDLPTGVLDPEGVDEAEFTIDAAAIDGEVGLFCSEEGWDTALANRPDSNAGPDFPIAVGADGTRYTLNAWSPPEPGFDGCRVDLVARQPNGAIRWSRTIAPEITAPWTYQWGDFDWDVRLFPSAVDGSIEVQLLKMYVGVGGTRSVGALALARLDADGHGRLQWGEGSTLQPVLRQLVGVSDRMNPPDVALGSDRCTHNAVQAPFGVPADAVRVWYLGDGTQVVQPNPVDHCYRHRGTYLVQFVDYRNGRPIGGAGPWEVAAPP